MNLYYVGALTVVQTGKRDKQSNPEYLVRRTLLSGTAEGIWRIIPQKENCEVWVYLFRYHFH